MRKEQPWLDKWDELIDDITRTNNALLITPRLAREKYNTPDDKYDDFALYLENRWDFYIARCALSAMYVGFNENKEMTIEDNMDKEEDLVIKWIQLIKDTAMLHEVDVHSVKYRGIEGRCDVLLIDDKDDEGQYDRIMERLKSFPGTVEVRRGMQTGCVVVRTISLRFNLNNEKENNDKPCSWDDKYNYIFGKNKWIDFLSDIYNCYEKPLKLSSFDIGHKYGVRDSKVFLQMLRESKCLMVEKLTLGGVKIWVAGRNYGE